MSIIEPGTPAPQFTLTTADGGTFTDADLLGKTSVLVFYPYAFSGVCTTHFLAYEDVLDQFEQRGATLYAISTDGRHAQAAFKEKLSSTVEQLSDYEPKGATADAFGVRHPGGMANRAVVVVGPDGVVKWSHEAAALADVPPAELIFEGLDGA